MNSDCKVTFFHSPNSRSVGTLILLEELGADYELGTLDLQKDEQRQAGYLAINPMGKVRAIVHRGVRSSPSRRRLHLSRRSPSRSRHHAEIGRAHV